MRGHSLLLSAACLCLMVSGCSLMPNSGASRAQVQRAAHSASLNGIVVRRVDDALARKLSDSKHYARFSEVFGNGREGSYRVGPGDTIEVTLLETPPGLLFGRTTLVPASGDLESPMLVLPAQMIMEDGDISVPFAGRVRAAGRSPHEIERAIERRLAGKANEPQVIVRVAGSLTSQVPVLGDVKQSGNLTLTPKGERVLDALAASGGVVQPVTKVSLQLSRGGATAAMPLDVIIRDPGQNIYLQRGDVLTALFQPWTISMLGATGKNEEIPFEAQGISLAQALARAGGLSDNRADPGGVFVFRFEDASLVDAQPGDAAPMAVNGKIPVVYQVDFNDPGAFLVTQNFPMQDKDVVYVANMPAAELEKFLRMVGLLATPSLNLWYYNMRLTTD